MAGELLEPGDVYALGDAARDRAAAQAVAGKGRTIEPGAVGPFLDDKRDRIGIDRPGTNPVTVGYQLTLYSFSDARRRQAPQPPEQRPSLIPAAASQASSAVTGQRSVCPVGSHTVVPCAS